MGVLPRKIAEHFVITSDRDAGGVVSRRAPARLSDTYQVWTGERWSTTGDEAQTFATLDAAEDYMRAHFAKIMA